MKKSITTIAILFLTFSMYAQGNKQMYYQKMGQTLGGFASCKTVEDYNNLSNQFSVIAKVETTEWMPLYYTANCKIIMAFQEEDKVKKDAYLDEAEKIFETMISIAPEESEVFALQALFYTARLTVDPMTRGQEFSMKSNASAHKSLALNPNNPRAKYLLLANKIGFAQFFGKEIVAECQEAKELLENWDKLNETKNPLAPKWGKNNVEGIVKNCNSSVE